MKRRSVIKGLALLHVIGNVLPGEAAEAVVLQGSLGSITESTLSSFLDEKNIYRSMGFEPIINCRGSFNIIGGSIKLPVVGKALEAASTNFVQLDELADVTGKRLAELTQTEWGMVSSGCETEVKQITAAYVTNGSTSIQITSGHVQPGEEKIAAERLYEVLSKKRSFKPEMTAPTANLWGWVVEVQYALGTSQYSFVIEQEGNLIQVIFNN